MLEPRAVSRWLASVYTITYAPGTWWVHSAHRSDKASLGPQRLRSAVISTTASWISSRSFASGSSTEPAARRNHLRTAHAAESLRSPFMSHNFFF